MRALQAVPPLLCINPPSSSVMAFHPLPSSTMWKSKEDIFLSYVSSINWAKIMMNAL